MPFATKTVLDIILNFGVFTPLAVLHLVGTRLVIDHHIHGHRASLIMLCVGIGIEFIVTFWQTEISARAHTYDSLGFTAFSRTYNYIVSFANIYHLYALELLYDEISKHFGVKSHLEVAVTVVILLISLRALRRSVSLPFALEVDSPVASHEYFSAPCLHHEHPSETFHFFIDSLLTVGLVWTLVPLYWISGREAVEHVGFLHKPEHALLIGYGIVLVCWMLEHHVRELSMHFESDNKPLFKLLLEDVYILIATVGDILVWAALEQAGHHIVRQHSVHIHGHDVTGYVLNIGCFVLLTLFSVSCSVVGKGMTHDGHATGGGGVRFWKNYLHHHTE